MLCDYTLKHGVSNRFFILFNCLLLGMEIILEIGGLVFILLFLLAIITPGITVIGLICAFFAWYYELKRECYKWLIISSVSIVIFIIFKSFFTWSDINFIVSMFF